MGIYYRADLTATRANNKASTKAQHKTVQIHKTNTKVTKQI
jgi:hypothetical protein